MADEILKTEVTGDESVPYESWKEYEAAVLEGKEKVPEAPRAKPNEKYAFNVDEALDSIDLTFGGYTPSEDALMFFNIVRLVLGEDPEVDNGLMHYFLVDLVYGNIKREHFPYSPEIQARIRLNEKKIAIIASRFSAKSTIITAFMPIVTAVTGKMPNFGDVMFWVSFGDSQQAGAKVQANTVRDICEDSKFCKDYFEKMRFTDEECEFIRKGDEPVKKRAFMFKVKGAAGGSVRGIRYKTERPQIFTFDDIIKNEADANSPIIMQKLRSMIYSDAENATGKKGKIIIVNTPFNKKDPVYAALESGVWTPVCIPICEKISLDLKKSEYRGSWEAMKSYEDIMEKYEDAYYGDTLREFNQELMLRISSEEDKLMKDDQIQWYSRKALQKNLGAYNIIATTDYTASNDLKGDFSCTMIWAVNAQNDWFMLDLSVKKMTIAEQYNPVFRMVREWGSKYGRHVTVGVEIDGQQQLNLHALKKMMIEHNVYFGFAKQIGSPYGKEGISRRQATGAKHEQFMRVHPLFQQHKIYFPEELKDTPDMKEVLNELKYITYTGMGAKHDDCGTYDTLVDTPNGPVKLGELKDGDSVIGFNPLGSAVCKVEGARMTGIKPIINVELDSGEILRFSEFHPVLTKNGYVLVRDLQIGSKLLRNTEWKKQLSMVDINGVENQQDTIKQQLEQQMEVERIGCISLFMKKLMGQSLMEWKSIMQIIIKRITLQQIWSYLQVTSTKNTISNKIGRMGINLQGMWKHTFMKSKTWLKKESVENTWAKQKEKNYLMSQLNVHTVEKSLFHIRSHEKMLNTVQPYVEMLPEEQQLNLLSAQSVESYSKALVTKLQNAQTAVPKDVVKQLKDSIQRYVMSAELYSKAICISIGAEKNARELEKTDLPGKEICVKRIWASKPEKTYNFEVEKLHNYQVEDGFVVHNCLDCISMIATMDVILPSEYEAADVSGSYGEERSGYMWHRFSNDDDTESAGSTVF